MLEINHKTIIKHQTSMISTNNPTMWIKIQTRYEQTKDIGMLEINHKTIIKHQTSMISTNNHNLIKIGFGTKTKP
jgi:hypothetical protein